MLTERKRRRSSGSEEGQLAPSAKRSGAGQTPFAELGRDVWDSESSSSDSSGVSSPERAVGGAGVQGADSAGPSHSSPSSPAPFPAEWAPIGQISPAPYHSINRILREAHFNSLLVRNHPSAT
ncbi:hypothetical protein AAFF_G00255160 [Aldrovandia affinis]|uniref:Protein FAM104A n=1 Tax=Aldrovandia affinis TaxID=143900 RepID=A0AAD7RCC2_9TELE|nr:hypothetical protein AAFF_G00255160 [Aldrovandia affinis]